jgi:hypothetical protein
MVLSWMKACAVVGACMGAAIPMANAQTERIEVSSQAGGGHFKKVMIVVFENTSYANAIKLAPFQRFVQQGALFTNFNAIEHPSQGNYIALVAGDSFDIKTDGNVDLNVSHIGDLLERAGRDWRVYAEDYPGGPTNCYKNAQKGLWVRKHVPFLSFTNVTSDLKRCAKIRNASELDTDIRSGALADYSLYIPNLNNDGHDTGAAFAAGWFEAAFGPRVKDPAFMKDMLLIVTFDEAEFFGANRVFTAMVGDSVKPQVKNNQRLSHYSLLKMIEDEFGIGNLGRFDAEATAITGIWK